MIKDEILNVAKEIMAKDKNVITNKEKFKGIIMGNAHTSIFID